MVKTGAIRLQEIEGPSKHDQLAFCAFSFILSGSPTKAGYILVLPCIYHSNLEIRIEDLQIRGQGRLRERDLTYFFFAYSQNIDYPESFILPVFNSYHSVTFSEGGYTLSQSQNDQTSNI